MTSSSLSIPSEQNLIHSIQVSQTWTVEENARLLCVEGNRTVSVTHLAMVCNSDGFVRISITIRHDVE